MTIKARVIEAGHIPRCEERPGRLGEPGRWVVLKSEREESPPRVLLELSEEDCRKLAGRLYDEITLEIVDR